MSISLKKGLPVVSLMILVAGAGYYIIKNLEGDNRDNTTSVVQGSRKDCEGIVPKEVILRAQAIEDHKLEYVKVPKKILDGEQYIGAQINYVVDGKTLMIEQGLHGVVDGDPTKSYLSYYLQNGKIFYLHRDYRQYTSSTNLNVLNPEVKISEIADFFLGSNQEVCIWYSDHKKQPNNTNIDEMVNYFISGL